MNQVLKFSLIFLISYTFFLLILPQPNKLQENQIVINSNEEFTFWKMVSFDIVNNTKKSVAFKDYCPNSPVKVEYFNSWEKKEISKNIKTKDCKAISLNPWEKTNFNFWDENIKLFQKIWNYKVIFETQSWKIFEKNFSIKESWFFWKLWDSVFYKPIYNFLIWLIEVWPVHSLAFAIIILTIIIKTALLIPNHKALKNQKELQKIQPKLDEIKKKFAWDQAKIAQETMKIWKNNWVNPMWSCLPVLIQFPFLIAIFYIIKDWLTSNNAYLLYDFIWDFNYNLINHHFFWLFNLADTKVWILAILVWVTQYWQMNLTFKNQSKATWTDFMAIQMQMMSKMMKYIMPIMIAVFTFIMPAWLWIYWLVSTLFAALQQLYVNHINNNNWSNNSNKSWKKNKKNKNISDAVIVKRKPWKSWKKDWITVIDA